MVSVCLGQLLLDKAMCPSLSRLLTSCCLLASISPSVTQPPDVLLILVDDLKPSLGTLRHHDHQRTRKKTRHQLNIPLKLIAPHIGKIEDLTFLNSQLRSISRPVINLFFLGNLDSGVVYRVLWRQESFHAKHRQTCSKRNKIQVQLVASL